MPLELGTRLGPYEVVARIGAGCIGEVHKAKDTRLDRTVAIEVKWTNRPSLRDVTGPVGSRGSWERS